MSGCFIVKLLENVLDLSIKFTAVGKDALSDFAYRSESEVVIEGLSI